MPVVEYIQANSILSKLRTKDPYFGIEYNMNLYRGCQHACIYCDTRSTCYGIHDISKIAVKMNALDLLEKALSSKRRAKATIGTGSMNDPYMPLEEEMQLTRRALQILAKHKYPVHIITKGALVQRDADIIQDIAKTYAAVSFTVTAGKDSFAKIIEPNASPTSERFKAMEALAKQGIYTGVTLMPLLPFLNDTTANIENIMMQAKDAGASYVLPMFGVTLRQGSRNYFYKALDANFPGVKKQYQQQFGDSYECFSTNYKHLWEKFSELADKLKLQRRISFFEPPIPNEQLTLF